MYLQVKLCCVHYYLHEVQVPICWDVIQHNDGEAQGSPEGVTGGDNISWETLCQVWCLVAHE
jgi:hypothetical protein